MVDRGEVEAAAEALASLLEAGAAASGSAKQVCGFDGLHERTASW
jgi:hypothetical protein